MPLSNPSNPVVRSGTANNVSVNASATSIQLIAANAVRNSLSFFNDSTAVLYLKLGASASLTDWSVKLDANQFYELPEKYTGQVTGIWTAANGSCKICELS